ncbi:hypothetical protein [Pseudoalteromonas sp. 31A1]|uniref:hypothetical protein n=1 Tax=Pseudoalteromonas sp. 31A1 TaxID=2686351 RepID=UPI0013FE378E|nr:hypothetical protein [Pseudoalteromonas sp. 31A1]
MEFYRDIFNSVGWFIPPYVPMGVLGEIASEIKDKGSNFTQAELQHELGKIYTAEHLAAMVCERYTITPYISDFKEIIAEAVEAHFSGLGHVAVAGLMPVIEGAGKKLATHRNVQFKYIKDVFNNLAADCKTDSQQNNIGAVNEVVAMMDSFIEFSKSNLYINSSKYPQEDKTNRHGILHGAYSDQDYGEPINFFKAIAAIDFLCFISAFDASISWFAPSETESSKKLAKYYRICIEIYVHKPVIANKSLQQDK